jgi:Glycoside hydrolase family 44/Bacterial Ig-like domain (group 3)
LTQIRYADNLNLRRRFLEERNPQERFVRRTQIRAACTLATALCIIFAAASPTLRAQAAPTLTVDAAANTHPINPDIYGIANYSLDATFAKEILVPNIRWGGDGTTRYNWQQDSSNSGFDWYFMGGNGQATATPSASADLMINTYKSASNAHTLLTIPIIPYVNKSSAWSCSFPVATYGAQQSTNPYVFPNGNTCGNSIATSGTQLLDNNIYANHIDNTVALQQGWVQHLIATFGTAANGGVPYYQLDNEPGGWSNTHRDVEPTQPDYDTIISLGQQYAAMIKQTDPSAKVFGPVDFTLGGWIGTPSKQDNLYAGQYYLQQMAAYDQAHSQRILDYFDEHYYGGGSTDAAELESTRALWDPTFNSGSWVEQYYFDAPMQLLPRFQNWIQTYYPGTKLSISEYSFSSGTNPLVDALTEADVLGIYGRESLDFANFWTVPKPTDPVAYSFRLYRNYDGAGGEFGNTSVNSTSTDQSQLSIYGALRASDGALTVVAINKTTSAIQTTLTLANFNSSATAAVYTYSNANLQQIVAGAPVSVASNAFTYNFPAYSATVFVFTPASATLAASKTSLSASATLITSGQSVTFTTTVTPQSGSGVPTGSVSFRDGATQIGTGTLSSSGSATFTTSTLAVGPHSITSAYAGDTNFAASTSAVASVTVSAPAKTATVTSLSASATQLTAGQSVTFNSSVAPQSGAGIPTGSIAFLDGQTQIGTAPLTAGAASYTSANLAAGTHTISAAYSGDATNAASNSAAVTVTVAPAPTPDYTLSLSQSSLTVASGASGNLTITVTPKNNFKQTLSLACAGLPAGATCNFNPQTLTPSTGAVSATVTVQAPAAAASAAARDTAAPSATAPAPRTPILTFRIASLYILALGLTAIFAAAGKKRLAVSAVQFVAAAEKQRSDFSAAGFVAAAGKKRSGIGAALFVAEAGINRSVTAPAQFVPAFLACVMLAALLVTASCAGYSKNGTQPSQPQTYSVTITASAANSPTHSDQFTLTVTP